MQLPHAQLTLMSLMELHLPGRPQLESGIVLHFPHTLVCIHGRQAPMETGVTA